MSGLGHTPEMLRNGQLNVVFVVAVVAVAAL